MKSRTVRASWNDCSPTANVDRLCACVEVMVRVRLPQVFFGVLIESGLGEDPDPDLFSSGSDKIRRKGVP